MKTMNERALKIFDRSFICKTEHDGLLDYSFSEAEKDAIRTVLIQADKVSGAVKLANEIEQLGHQVRRLDANDVEDNNFRITISQSIKRAEKTLDAWKEKA